jgi:hypothetical protein
LKPKPYVDFDVNNPAHVAAIMEIELTGRRTMMFNFNHPHPFPGGVDYAKHLLAMEYMNQMAKQHPEVFKFERSTATMGSDPVSSTGTVRQLPVIGVRSKPLQDTPSRGLAPGSTLG